jgi:hypothetical protein
MVLQSYPLNLPPLTIQSGEYYQDSNVLLDLTRSGELLHGELWSGYDYDTLFEGGVSVWLNRNSAVLDPLLLGEIYLHKHLYETALPNDIRQMEALNLLQPSFASGMQIILNRDIHNIGYWAVTAWDQRLTITLDED